jgi:hypothetical protein
MTPIVASGAASLVGVLVNRAAGHASTSEGNHAIHPKDFERALNRAATTRERQVAEMQAAELRQRLLHSAEVEAAISNQPRGTVSGLEIKADGSVSLQTNRGPVAVQLGGASRELAQAVYLASAVQSSQGAAATNSAPQSPLLVPLELVQGAALR